VDYEHQLSNCCYWRPVIVHLILLMPQVHILVLHL